MTMTPSLFVHSFRRKVVGYVRRFGVRMMCADSLLCLPIGYGTRGMLTQMFQPGLNERFFAKHYGIAAVP
jgi:hypothetical protein